MTGLGNVVDLFTAQAAERPTEAALIEGTGRRRHVTTFADLDRAGAEGAGRLATAGVRRGDRVLVLVPVSARLYEVLAAVFRVGAVAVLVDPGAGIARLGEAVERVAPVALVGTPKAHLLWLVVPTVRRIPIQLCVGGWVPGAERWGGGPPVVTAEVGEAAPALLTFTSGTTGRPKATVRTHGLLAAQHAALSAALGLRSGQIDLATLPVVVLASLASGVTTVLADADLRRPGAIDAARLLRQIRAERPTRSTASPALFERLLDAAAPDDLISFERFDAGGAPVFPDLLDRLKSHADAVAVYGSTEAEPIAHLHAHDLTDADRQEIAAGGGLLAGRPVPEVDLRVVPDAWGTPLGPFSDVEWDRLGLAEGEVGEIVVAGAHVVPGYLDGKGDAETKVAVGDRRWHRTGDAGRLDAHGRLWLLGRCAAASRRGEAAVYPLQVEAAARAVGVRAGFVEIDGRRVMAFVGDPPAGLAEALAWAGIDEMVRVDALPVDRRHNAKIDRDALIRSLRAR